MTHDKQHTMLQLAAMSAPLALCAGCGWGTVLLASVVVLPLTCLPRRWEGMGLGLRWIQAAWMGLILGVLLKNSASFWPSHEGKTVPLILLALAYWTHNAAAVGAVLGFCLVVLYFPVSVSGAMQLEPGWLLPAFGEMNPVLPVVLLLPALLAGERRGRAARWTGILGTVLAMLTQGILSPWVAGSVEAPFYEMARTLSPGGISHVEPVIAVAVTLGWYALAAGILKRSGVRMVTAAAAAGAVLWDLSPKGMWMVVICVILWILIPFVRSETFLEKSEKRC